MDIERGDYLIDHWSNVIYELGQNCKRLYSYLWQHGWG